MASENWCALMEKSCLQHYTLILAYQVIVNKYVHYCIFTKQFCTITSSSQKYFRWTRNRFGWLSASQPSKKFFHQPPNWRRFSPKKSKTTVNALISVITRCIFSTVGISSDHLLLCQKRLPLHIASIEFLNLSPGWYFSPRALQRRLHFTWCVFIDCICSQKTMFVGVVALCYQHHVLRW